MNHSTKYSWLLAIALTSFFLFSCQLNPTSDGFAWEEKDGRITIIKSKVEQKPSVQPNTTYTKPSSDLRHSLQQIAERMGSVWSSSPAESPHTPVFHRTA